MERQRSTRVQHRAAVLSLLHRGHELTRGEISERLGLTRSTVSEVLASLRGDGILDTSVSAPHGGRGRPAEVVRIHPGAVRSIGLDFSHSAVTVCLANSAGDVVASGSTPYPFSTGWETRVRHGVDLVHSLCIGDVHLGQLAGIGIGLPGPNSASWDGFHPLADTTEPFHLVRARIREVFGEEFDAPVLVDHHIRFAAMQEAAAVEGVGHSLVYLRLSTGVGGAVVGGHVALRGSNLLAGEIGHMVVDRSANARACRCGRRGCLETIASKSAVQEQWRAIAGDDHDLATLEAALDAANPAARELVTELAQTVGHVVGIAALVMDPDEVVIAGEVGALLAPALPNLQDAVAMEVLTSADLTVRIATVDPEQGARGAITALRTEDGTTDFYRDSRTRPDRAPDHAGGLSVH